MELWNKSTKARHVKGVPGGLVERPLCEAVKLKPGLPWTIHDVRDSRVMGYLLRSAANRGWNQPKRKKCVAINKAEKELENWSVLTSDMGL